MLVRVCHVGEWRRCWGGRWDEISCSSFAVILHFVPLQSEKGKPYVFSSYKKLCVCVCVCVCGVCVCEAAIKVWRNKKVRTQ